LASRVDEIADEEIGLIIIINPRNMDALMRLPSLYPDVKFSIIGVSTPLYLPNVSSMQFKDQEGMFMLGALAAMHSKTGSIGLLASDDGNNTRNLAYGFFQGAQYVNPDIKLSQQFNAGDKAKSSEPDSADVLLVMDSALLDSAVRTARQQKLLLIPLDQDLTVQYPGMVLTALLKHYDLAVYTALRNYQHNQWKPGVQMMGLNEGYIDYALDDANRKLFPAGTIDQIERIKDLVSENVIKILSPK
jgi:basic membrane protein A